MWLSPNTQVWLYRQPVDFRKQIDGLVILAADALQKNPTSGHWFVFRNKKADKVKILLWEDNGFWLLYKRFEKAVFKFPKIENETMSLTMSELQWLLSGLDFTQHQPLLKLNVTHFT